jgi:hypothetical protein
MATTTSGSVGQPVGSSAPRASRDGSIAGLLVGCLASVPVAISWWTGGSVEWWLLASIPAGFAAGSVAGPSIAPGRRIAFRTVAGAATTAFLVGDAVVCLALLVLDGPRSDWSILAAVANTVQLYVLGVITVGFLAMLVLLPIAAVAAFVLRAWRARRGAS